MALELHNKGYNCAQSVLVAYAEEVDVDRNVAFRIGAGLGGGVGRTQNICGAINAGAIILGLKFGAYSPDDVESKNRISELVSRFIHDCNQSLGSTQCLELVKVDLNNPDQKKFAKDSGYLSRICDNAISETARILNIYLKA